MKKSIFFTIAMLCGLCFMGMAQTPVASYNFNGNLLDNSSIHDGVLQELVPAPTAAQIPTTNPGTVTYGDDRFNNANSAVVLNGVDEFIQYNSISPGFQIANPPISISAWVFLDNDNQSDMIFSNSMDYDAYHGVALNILGDGEIVLSYCDGGPISPANRRSVSSGQVVVPPGEWHHVAAVISDYGWINMELYLDGIRLCVDSSGTGGDPIFYGNNDKGWSGLADPLNGSNQLLTNFRFFGGRLDDLALYDIALTAEMIDSLAGVSCQLDTICSGESITLTGPSSSNYVWENQLGQTIGTSQSILVSPSQTTTYSLIVGGASCLDTLCYEVEVNESITTEIDTVVCIGDSLQLDGGTGISYSWTPSTGLSNSSISNPWAYPSGPIVYTGLVEQVSGCVDTVIYDIFADSCVSASCCDNPIDAQLAFTQDPNNIYHFTFYNLSTGPFDEVILTVDDNMGSGPVIMYSGPNTVPLLDVVLNRADLFEFCLTVRRTIQVRDGTTRICESTICMTVFSASNRPASTEIQSTNPEAQESWNVYPNPTSSFLNFDFSGRDSDPINVSIYDMRGREVLSTQVSGAKIETISVEHLPAGVYTVRAAESDQISVKRVIIQR
ncbi:LamG-like jellyroll fold domain-containing protein [Pontibacter sp. G13]|uniref:LamG-like jellyroll fold domain-containing protein n=1 Tax=Pontibacter sp. G13 TaxID=3074898 RepID=UPI00288AF5CE|nr:LamG-like jellyroll fold domain-containing protein [Pontibacter sp. G13]WNJ16669.1 LamG-like jellyroll fold domain-containing protein [Pontibacter sp. G13]